MLGLARYHGENYLYIDMIAPIHCIVVQVDCEMSLYFTSSYYSLVFQRIRKQPFNTMNATVPKGMDVACVGMCTVSG